MKKHFRIIGIVLVIAIIAVLIWFGNVMMGNPVSHALASKAAKSFLSDRFSGTDYQMERITYSFRTADIMLLCSPLPALTVTSLCAFLC